MAETNLFIIYSNRSLHDAEMIKGYLLFKFTQREVDQFYWQLESFEHIVVHYPNLYPQSKSKGLRRAVLSKQLSVFYKPTDKIIEVIAILDNRMDTQKWPK